MGSDQNHFVLNVLDEQSNHSPAPSWAHILPWPWLRVADLKSDVATHGFRRFACHSQLHGTGQRGQCSFVPWSVWLWVGENPKAGELAAMNMVGRM